MLLKIIVGELLLPIPTTAKKKKKKTKTESQLPGVSN